MATNSNDVITGSLSSETIDALAGDDIVRAGAGDDRVFGRDGADELYGEGGKDRIFGGGGGDLIDGGDGNDRLYGEAGNDEIFGGASGDLIDGGIGDDVLAGGRGNDSILGGDGSDWLSGQEGSDILVGGAGDDMFAYGMWALDGERGGANITLVGDFVRGQDKLAFELQTEHDLVTWGLDRFDTNRDGALGVGDRGVTLQAATFDGATRTSLVIDLEATRLAQFDSFSPGAHRITLFGITSLGAADLVPTGTW